jgi:hypothetical protein
MTSDDSEYANSRPIRENGQRHLGTFATPEEAALRYARYIGAERSMAEAAHARVEGPQQLTPDEARVAAAAEGLELLPSSSGESGFKGVVMHYGKYQARIEEKGNLRHLGTFATPEEAALCYARHAGAERAVAEAAEARGKRPRPLTADEARVAAAAEGLVLVPSSSSETGFRGVTKKYGMYKARVLERGMQRHLGSFTTPEEAALCYARHVGAERAAAQAAEVRVTLPQPLTADEARAAAAAEGLELVLSSYGETGFKGVCKHHGKYMGRIKENGKARHLGFFATPEEAALCYARHAGAKRAAAEASVARGEGLQPLTADEADEVRAVAAAEGLELVPSWTCESGFKGVTKTYYKYKAHTTENGKMRHLGTFATPEEAALCYARHIGAERSAAEAAEARVERPRPLTADEARAAAAAEGLELVPSSSSETGFKAVCNRSGRYTTETWENGRTRYLGSFATPEEAALCYARHVRDLVDGWLIPGPRPPHRPPSQAPVPAPPTPSEVEQAEAFTSMHEDQRKQQGSPSSLPAATTEHASRKRLAVAVAFAEVVLQGATPFQPQLTPESGDDPGAARCVICLEALDLSAASSRGEAACGHTPCCGNYFHKRCLSQCLQGSGQSDNDPLPIERLDKKCPTCRREQLVARTLVPGRRAVAMGHQGGHPGVIRRESSGRRAVAVGQSESAVSATASKSGHSEAAVSATASKSGHSEAAVSATSSKSGHSEAAVSATSSKSGHSEAAVSTTNSKSGSKRRAVAVDGEAVAQARLRELEDELKEEEMLALETALGVKRVPSAAAFVAALQAWESPE